MARLRMWRTDVAVGLLLGACVAGTAAARPLGFVPLGELPGGSDDCFATGLSDDGERVVGYCDGAAGFEAFLWTSTGGMQRVGDLPGGGAYSRARAISGDGSTIVGDSLSSLGAEPFRWRAEDGMQGLGFLATSRSGWATGVSWDGSHVVGTMLPSESGTRAEAFRWSEGVGMVGLGDSDPEFEMVEANWVSPDGTMVIGSAVSNAPQQWIRGVALRDDGAFDVLPVHAGGVYSVGVVASGDGDRIVTYGNSMSSFGGEPGGEGLLVDASTGAMALGDLPGDPYYLSIPHDITDDGSIVVGYSSGSIQHVEAFVWDDANGMRSLQLYLEARGVDLAGWTLRAAVGVTPDGGTIAGWGNNAQGDIEPFVAYVPEPSAASLLAAGAFALAAISQRRRTRRSAR